MKYKLININTKEETICDKVTIDTFDYYVNNEKLIPNCYVFDPISNRITIIYIVNKKGENFGAKKVIATNNPNIDIPKVIDEVERLSEELSKEYSVYETAQDDVYQGIMIGYNKSQESYPFSEKDMVEFAEWIINQDWDETELNFPNNSKSTKELLQLWKEQRPKIVYYENNKMGC